MTDFGPRLMMQAILTNWLLVNGYAEEHRGYGHVAACDLAEALLDTFVITLPAP